MDMDLGDEAVGCKGLQEQGKNSCYAILSVTFQSFSSPVLPKP